MKICGSVTAFMVDEFQKDYRCEKSENDTLPKLWIWIKLRIKKEKRKKYSLWDDVRSQSEDEMR